MAASNSRKRPSEVIIIDCDESSSPPPDIQNINAGDDNETKPDIPSLEQQQPPMQKIKTKVKQELEPKKKVKKETEKKKELKKSELCACSPNYACSLNYSSSSNCTTFSTYARSIGVAAGSSNDDAPKRDETDTWSRGANVELQKLQLKHFISKNSTRNRDKLDDLFDELNDSY